MEFWIPVKTWDDTLDFQETKLKVIVVVTKHGKTLYWYIAGEVRPILKSAGLRADSPSFREDSPRPRLSFCGEPDSDDNSTDSRKRNSRRSYTICSDFNVQSNAITRDKQEDRDLTKARPLSVFELVKSFERQLSNEGGSGNKGAVPKRLSQKRNSDRYRTQPVTSDELQER